MARTTGRGFKIDLEAAVDAMGVERVIETVGLDRVLEHFGPEKLIKQIGLDAFLANLSPAERRELKRRLQ